MLSAIESGDIELYQRLVEKRIDAIVESHERTTYCIHCRALMAVADSGEQFCPYKRERNHDRAKAMLAPKAIDMLEWTKAKISEAPAQQRLHHNRQPRPRKNRSAAIITRGTN